MIIKKRTRSSSWKPSYEVRVTPAQRKSSNIIQRKSTSIRFTQSSFEKITKTGYIELTLESNQLYMRASDEANGYKVSIDNVRADGFMGGKIHSHDKELYSWAKKNKGIYNIKNLGNDLYTLERVSEKGNY